MVRGASVESSMSGILDYGGMAFANIEEQKLFIREHFAKSYKKNQNEPENYANCIENFLGVDILNSPIVANLKLTEQEKIELEQNLTLEELDIAIEEANKKSAAGLDGISSRFVYQFWDIFKKPLLRYANCVFDKGRLTQSFKSALVKLIPKKGNATDINQWRPISLLGCTYKVLSRAINNRLKKVINRFTSRAQKGFTNHRHIQEVLINVCEIISHCKTNDISGALLSIDQSKAFDCISHRYMTEV
jgi:hypothetical protein